MCIFYKMLELKFLGMRVFEIFEFLIVCVGFLKGYSNWSDCLFVDYDFKYVFVVDLVYGG